MKAFIQDANGDHNFDYEVEMSPKAFIQQIREQGGYYVPSDIYIEETTEAPAHREVDGVVFVPWHQIHFVRFTEV